MSMMTLKCPKCGTEAKVSFAENNYSGPRRCWKCHEYFTITIENNRVTFCEPLSAEEYQRQQDAKKAAEKGGGGLSFSSQPPQYSQQAAEPVQASAKPPKEEEPDIFSSLAGKSKGGIDFSPSPRNDYAPPPPPAPPAPKTEAPAGRADDLLFSSLKSKAKSSDSHRPAQNDYQAPPLTMKDIPKPPIPVFPPSDAKPSTSNPPPKAKTYITPGQSQSDPKKPAVFPPDQIRTFVPQEDVKIEPPKPKKKDVPHEDAWNSFIPPQT
jgi:hypothetical protein